MWLAYLKNKMPFDQIKEEWKETHLSRLVKLREEGVVLAHGRVADGSGGYFLFNTTHEEMEKYLAEDPYVQNGVSELVEAKDWVVNFSSRINET